MNDKVKKNDPTRKLAAIMFTDIVGYSKLVQQDEDKALDLLDQHNDIVRPIISKHGGDEIKTIGDAFLVQFESTTKATNCGVDIQKQMVSHNSVQSKHIIILKNNITKVNTNTNLFSFFF